MFDLMISKLDVFERGGGLPGVAAQTYALPSEDSSWNPKMFWKSPPLKLNYQEISESLSNPSIEPCYVWWFADGGRRVA